jgi:putative oxidoreductase
MTVSSGAILLAGRVLFAVFFASAAWGHIRGHAARVEYGRAARVPVPYVAGWPSGVWLAAGAASIALGVWPDIGALMLAAFVLPAGLLLHAYWRVDDSGQRQTQKMAFLRNVALLGACLSLFACFATLGEQLRFVVAAPLVHL